MEVDIARMWKCVVTFHPVLTKKGKLRRKKRKRKKSPRLSSSDRAPSPSPWNDCVNLSFFSLQPSIFRRATRANTTATVHKKGRQTQMEFWLHPTVLYGVTAYLPTLMTSPDKSSKIGPRVITAVRDSGQFYRLMHPSWTSSVCKFHIRWVFHRIFLFFLLQFQKKYSVQTNKNLRRRNRDARRKPSDASLLPRYA